VVLRAKADEAASERLEWRDGGVDQHTTLPEIIIDRGAALPPCCSRCTSTTRQAA